MKTKYYLIILLTLLGSLLLKAGTWPAWRGGTLQGHAESAPLPVSWGAHSNVLWKTTLPGEGFSSPVVSEDTVYLTAVTKAAGSNVINPAAKAIEYGLLLLLVGSGLHNLTRSIEPGPAQVPRAWPSRVASVAALGILAGMVLFADGVVHFDALSRWGQLAVAAAFSAAFFACALATGSWKRSRARSLAVSIACWLAAGALLLLLIQRASQWTQLWKAPVTLALALGLAAVGLLHIGRVMETWETPEIPDTASTPRGGTRGTILGTWIGAAVLALVACGVVIRLFVQTQGAATLTFDNYSPALPAWIWSIVLVLVLALFGVPKARNYWTRAGLILAAFVGAPVLVALLFEAGLVHVRYLRHVMLARLPSWNALFGWPGVLVCLVVAAVAIALGLWLRPVAVRNPRREWKLFRFAATALGLVTLVHWGGIIFALGHFGDALSVVAVNRADGTLRWVRRAADAPAQFERLNSRATPTPVTWSNRVVAYFGTQGLFCFDADGKRQWACTNLPCESQYGASISPVFCDGRIFISSEPSTLVARPGPGYLAAVDGADGHALWKTTRPSVPKHTGNYATPLVLNFNGTNLVVVWGGEDVTAYDPISGREIWKREFSGTLAGKDLVASPVSDGEKLYLPLHDAILAVRRSRLAAGGQPLAWRTRCPGLYCASPVVANGLLFAVSDPGLVSCFDAETGALLWKKKLKGTHYCSPIVAGGYVYFCSTDGRTTVFRCDRAGQVVAENELNERVVASFAPVDGRLFIRSQAKLYCIGEVGR